MIILKHNWSEHQILDNDINIAFTPTRLKDISCFSCFLTNLYLLLEFEEKFVSSTIKKDENLTGCDNI